MGMVYIKIRYKLAPQVKRIMNTLEQEKDKTLECPVSHKGRSNFKRWMKRLGVAGFIFFLLKGLVWIAVFAFGAEAIKSLF
jgi:hypothetical protein